MSTCHFSFSIPRKLADKRSDLLSTPISDKILPSSCTRSRFHSKFKAVRINTSSEFHVHRHGMSDITRIRVPADRVEALILTIRSVLSHNQVSARTFLSLLGKLRAAADFVLLGRLHLRPLQMCLLSVWMETPHSSSQSSDHNQQYALISFEMVHNSRFA